MKENGAMSPGNSAVRVTLVNATIDTVASKNAFIVSTCVGERISFNHLAILRYSAASCIRTTSLHSMNHLNEGKRAQHTRCTRSISNKSQMIERSDIKAAARTGDRMA